MTILRAGALIFVCVLLRLPISAADWPQWRGPDRDGKSTETGLLGEWPEGGPSLAWKAGGVGKGYSSVSVAQGRIFTMGDFPDGQHVVALSQKNGDLLWKARVGPRHEHEYGGPRSTPTTDGDRIYVVSTAGDVVCLEAETGKELWRRSLVKEFGGSMMKAQGRYEWRFSESPLVDGDRVVVTPGNAGALVVALSKNDGKELWRTKGGPLGDAGTDGAGYSSAVVSTAGGIRQYVQLIGRGLIGVDAGNGRLLWSYNRIANDVANIATPVVDGDRVFASTGYGTGAALIRIRKAEDALRAEEVYFLDADTMQNHHGGLILHEGTIYTGSGHNKGFPIAVDLNEGNVAWGPQRTAGKSSAAIAYADGRIYFRYQDGRMILVDADSTAYRERGTFMIPEVKQESWAHPVICDGRLLLREQDQLYSYDIRARKRVRKSTPATR